MEEARYDYEKQHQAVDIPSLSGLPEMVRTVASAIVGRYNSMAACGHVLFFEEGMNGPVTPDRHIILLHARYTKNLHNSCISYFYVDNNALRQIALAASGSHCFSTVLSIVSHHITSPDSTHISGI